MSKLCPYCGEVLVISITAGMPYCDSCWHVIEKQEKKLKNTPNNDE